MRKKFISLILSMCMIISLSIFPTIASAEQKNWALASNGATQTGTKATGNIIDGNMGTSDWIGSGSYIQVNLASSISVSKINVYTTSYAHYVAYSANGETWTDVAYTNRGKVAGTGYYLVEYALPAAASAKYVKVSAGAGNTIYECEVFGEIASTPYLKSMELSSGSLLPEFSQNTAEYTAEILDLNNLPSINYETLAADAEVVYTAASEENGYKAEIQVNHGGSSFTYYIQFVQTVKNPYLTSLTTEFGSLSPEFSYLTSDYEVVIDSFYDLPEITYEKLEESASVTYTPASSENGYKASIEVSHNGASFTYNVQFKQDVTNLYLASLTPSTGVLSPAFSQTVTSYESIAGSASNLPVLSYETANENAETSFTPASAENDYTATITVSYGGGELSYIVKYVVIPEDSADLRSLKVSENEGEPALVANFNSNTTEYVHFSDSQEMPVISAETMNPDATVRIIQPTKKRPTAIVYVTSRDESNTKEYKVDIATNIALGKSAWGSSAYSGMDGDKAVDGNLTTDYFASAKVVGGGTLTVNLEANSKIYAITLKTVQSGSVQYYDKLSVSMDGNTWTEIEGESLREVANYPYPGAVANIRELVYSFAEVPFDAKYLRVSGTSTLTFNARVSELIVYGVREPMVSADAFLKSITLSEGSIPGFSSYITDYTVKLGENDEIPRISAETVDPIANAVITQATEDNPVAKVVVTAENGVSKMTYTVSFEKELSPANNAYLSSLSVGRGVLLPEFSPANTNYTLYLEPGSDVISADEITATAQISGASVVKTEGDPLTVLVTSTGGTQSKTYVIDVEYASAKLASLDVSGYELSPQFSPSVTDYTIELQAGEEIPMLGVELDGKYIRPVAESGTTLNITQATQNSPVAVITVTDENGVLTQNYIITFKYAQSLANAQSSVQSAIREFKVSNDTTPDELIALIKDSVTNDVIEVVVSTPFSIKKATTSEQGIVTGSVTLRYGEESVVITVRKVIDKLTGGGGGSSSGGGGGGGSTPDSSDKDNKEETPSVDRDPYTEIRGHWAEKEVIYLAENGIVEGNGTSFALADTVTRAEFITMLIRAGKFDIVAYGNSFDDVSENDWFAQYVQTAFDKGFISGFNGKVNPLSTTTREEAVKMLVGVYENLKEEIVVSEEKLFADSDSISLWATEYVQKAVSEELVQGFDTGEFKAKDTLTRAQAMVMIYRLINNN